MDNLLAKSIRFMTKGRLEAAERELRQIHESAKWMGDTVEIRTSKREAGELLTRIETRKYFANKQRYVTGSCTGDRTESK